MLCKRIKALSQQIPSLQAECQTLIQRKQALVHKAKQQLLTNRTQLHTLSSTCGVPVQEDQAVLADFAAALEGWGQQSAQRNQELSGQPATYLSREELNRALAGSMLAR